jgi:hypothetical protein
MKHIIALLFVLLAITIIVVPVGAEEIPEVTESVTTAPVTEAPTVTESLTGESPVKDVSDYLKEWVPEILSAAALALSAVITYLFKKGLLPGVKKALTSIDSTVTGYNANVKAFVDKLSEELKLSQETNAALVEKLVLQEKHVNSVLLVVEKALITQSDALCDLLENTNLPAQTKAEIAAKHKAQVEEIVGLIDAE